MASLLRIVKLPVRALCRKVTWWGVQLEKVFPTYELINITQIRWFTYKNDNIRAWFLVRDGWFFSLNSKS